MADDIQRRIPSKARARKAMKAFRASLRPVPSGDKLPGKSARRTYRALYVVRSEKIVKLGITGNLDRRLAQHQTQGLYKVVYVLHSRHSQSIVDLEKSWRAFVRANPSLRITREELPDGYTEALPLSAQVKEFIDRLIKSV